MHTTQTYPLSHRFLVAAPPRSGTLAYLRGFALTVWLFTMLFRLWWVSDWWALQELFQSGFDVKGYFYYGFAVMIAGHLTLGPQAWISAPFAILSDWTGRFITIFLLMMLCLAPLSLNQWNSGKYAIATLVVLILMHLFWMSNYRVHQRVLTLTGIVLFGWLLVLMVKHGLTGGFAGQIGGINRNVTSTAALAAMVFTLFSPKPMIRLVAITCAGFLIVAVTSRGSILAMGVFVAVYYALHKGTVKAAIHAMLAFMLGGIVLVTIPFFQDLILNDIFRLNQHDRGVTSGFSGRFDMWKQALQSVWKKPVLGWGFRTTSQGGGGNFGGIHSAYIKIVLEGGFVGAFFLIAASVTELVRRLRLSMRLRLMRPSDMPGVDVAQSYHINSLACSTMCALMTLWIYDQYYINLGSPISIVYFLMILAPTFITSQGITLRQPEAKVRQLALVGGMRR
jgi:O-antigen ligase